MESTQKFGHIHVPRVIGDQTLQRHLISRSTEPEPELQKFFQSTRALRLEVATPGLLDSLRFIEDTTATAPLAAHELRMQPRAYDINFRDVMIALGQLEDISVMFSGHSGVVTELGSDLVGRFQAGDRICAWGGSPYAGSVTVNEDFVQQIPGGMTFEAAASVPIVYATVYYGLVHLARLQKGESVVIHSATGGVGQAAVMLAKHLGASVFVAVGSNAKKHQVMKGYDIPEDHVFSSRELSFAASIKRLTNGRGVDVVLSSIAGEAFHETFECLTKLGRFVEIGKRDVLANGRLDIATSDKSVTFDLTNVLEQDPILTKRMITEAFAILASGMIHPVQPLNIISLSDMESVFRLIQAGKHSGKVVLQTDDSTTVKRFVPFCQLHNVHALTQTPYRRSLARVL